MPDVFRARRSKNDLARRLSNFCLPNGNGALFRDYEPRTLESITDGSSRTAMIVEVDDDSAEVWTKPGGWPFAPAKPISGLGGHIGQRIHFARADGSTDVLAPEYPSWVELMTSDAGDFPR